MTFSENIVWVISQTSAVIFWKNASSSGSRDAMRSSGSRSASLNLAVHAGPSARDMPSNSPLESPSVNAKTVDRSMPITRGLRSSTTVFSNSHCSSPQSSACRPRTAPPPVTARVDVRASKTPPCVDPPSAILSMHVALTAVPAAAHLSKNTSIVRRLRRECFGRDDGGEDGVFVVFAIGTTQRSMPYCASARQERVEALLQPGLLHRRLFAQRAEGREAAGNALVARRSWTMKSARSPTAGRLGTNTNNTVASNSRRPIAGYKFRAKGQGQRRSLESPN